MDALFSFAIALVLPAVGAGVLIGAFMAVSDE